MPTFFGSELANNTTGSAVQYDLITIDTENALLALAGKASPSVVQTAVDTGPINLPEPLSGIGDWIGKVIDMLFGTKQPTDPSPPVYTETHYDFQENEAMTMTLPVSADGGSTVDRFESFKLMGIHSVNAAHVDETCRVEKSFMMIPTGSKTFYRSRGTLKTDWSIGSNPDTHDEWVSWCKSKGVGGSTTVMIFTKYTVKAYNNGGVGFGRGLVIDLKKVNLTPSQRYNTTTVKLLNVTH